jgi:hypothetical protein
MMKTCSLCQWIWLDYEKPDKSYAICANRDSKHFEKPLIGFDTCPLWEACKVLKAAETEEQRVVAVRADVARFL